MRTPAPPGSTPRAHTEAGRLQLPGGASVDLVERSPNSPRLWEAVVEVPGDLLAYLAAHGRPIRYRYASRPWNLGFYQTVYARHPGSAEMPSAGRPFTPQLIAALAARGIMFGPVTLHSGVASPEAGEGPQPERALVPAATARMVNAARAGGGRIIAVGTTAARAVETAARSDGAVAAFEGYSRLVIGRGRPPLVVQGLLTGWHEPRASHLDLVEAVAGAELAVSMYRRAVSQAYLWHEFGDSCLILP